MSKAGRSAISSEQVQSMLGAIAVPGSGPNSFDDFIDAISKPTPNVMRLRRGVSPTELPVATDPVDWYGLGRRPVANQPKPSRFLAYAGGDYYIQDAGSLLALAAAGADTDVLSGKLVCDLCAAPGGKATALVEAIENSGFLLANEVIGSRIGPLQLNLSRTGSDRYAVSNLDPASLADRLGPVFDLVLVDAPCSGQAMLGKGKQKNASLTARQIEHSAIRQNRILDAAVRLVRDGGQLVYSTCTFAAAENELQVARLQESGVARDHLIDRLSAYQSAAGCYRLWPHQHDCAGAFAASLQIHQVDSVAERRFRPPERTKPPQELANWYIDWSDTMRLQTTNSVVYGWPIDAPAWVDRLAIAGPELAHLVGQTWKPSHAAALRRDACCRALQQVDIDDGQAKRFMRGEAIECQGTGWQVATWKGRPLGWIKATNSVGKNHLVKSARMPGELIG